VWKTDLRLLPPKIGALSDHTRGPSKLGGALQYGIPEYRLPKKILDWEIEGILSVGIEARVNTVP
jgi:hypothetical protein